MVNFDELKTLFVDSEENEYYVELIKSKFAYSKLDNCLKNPFKLLLLYGRPGTGKSFLLQKFYKENKDKHHMFFFKEPIFYNTLSLKSIYSKVTGKKADDHLEFAQFVQWVANELNEDVFVLLDEAQLYNDEALEWIRLLSNRPHMKFIISVHKVDKEDLLAKEHFKTRTFESIEFADISKEELKEYIGKKLLAIKRLDFWEKFSESNFKCIYKHSKGNLRNINRLLYRSLELLEYKYNQDPKVANTNIKNKFIEMAAMDLQMEQ